MALGTLAAAVRGWVWLARTAVSQRLNGQTPWQVRQQLATAPPRLPEHRLRDGGEKALKNGHFAASSGNIVLVAEV
ncbi:hypothetical protein [Sphingomonas sp.]|uniref:hypothetical protein n=1 Tax=Sphingomonas sp. TaxID=28214 RepID=UPI002DF4B207|nr:hypothetical protein [Sphingomonas sp.]